jgi:hypothetical protein
MKTSTYGINGKGGAKGYDLPVRYFAAEAA